MIKNNSHIISAISKRSDGSMMTNRILQKGNVRRFLDLYGIPFESTHCMQQVHGNTVAYVHENSPQIFEATDGLVTDKPEVFLGAVTADCVPITVSDQRAQVVGVAHAGYKGILAGIVTNLIAKARDCGADNSSLYITIGPSIGSCCYDIDEDRAGDFYQQFQTENIFRYSGDKIFLDLSKVVSHVIKKEGIVNKNVMMTGICTKCHNDSYFSYRGDTKKTFGECMTIIGMRNTR